MKHWFLRLAIFAALLAPLPAVADQGSLCTSTSGLVSGLQYAQQVNAALQALVTENSGTVAPTNPCGGVAQAGQVWLDTSSTPNVLKVFDGTSWLPEGSVDQTNHIWTPPVGGGTNSIASSGTTDLGSLPQAYLTISGTTGITGFGSTAITGTFKFINFSGSLTLTYNATSMILPTAASITTQAGDRAIVVALGSGHWAVVSYDRADGSSLSGGTLSSQIIFGGVITPSSLSGTTNDWAPTGLATAAIIRGNASSNAIVTGLTAQPANTFLILQNINASTTITLNDADGGSSTANRFAFGVNYVLGPKAAIQLRYDSTLSRWVIAAGPLPASQAQATAGTDNSTIMSPLRTAQAIAALSGSNIQSFSSSGTWTKPSSGTVALAQCWGAGGSGSRVSSGSAVGAPGGGGGAYVAFMFPFSALSATETVTVGTGGAAVSSNGDGLDGGLSSFGSHLVALGGGGTGLGGIAPYGSSGGTAGTTSANGQDSGAGGAGGGGSSNSGSSVNGVGGNSTFGGAGGNSSGSAGGTSSASPGVQPGGGGGGVRNGGSSGAGANGKCIIVSF